MKIGVKTFDSKKFLDYFKDKCDFFEVQAIETNNYDFLKKYNLPIIIHSQHQGSGINNADKSNNNKNLQSINFAIKIANFCNAKKIIIHPGEILNENCSKKNSIDFIKNINDNRIIIENMPNESGKLCTTPKETKEFLKTTKKGLCFDINHAIHYATNNNLDYVKFLKDFIKLKPVHFHLGGQNIKKNIDGHLSLKDSDFDIKEIIKLLPYNEEITLETTTDIKNVEEDIKIFKGIFKELHKI